MVNSARRELETRRNDGIRTTETVRLRVVDVRANSCDEVRRYERAKSICQLPRNAPIFAGHINRRLVMERISHVSDNTSDTFFLIW